MEKFGTDAIYVNDNGSENQAEVDIWLEKYHKYRPHESLNILTPSEFETKLNSGFSMADVS